MNDARQRITLELARADRPCLTSSFQVEDLVLLDLVRRERPAIPVIFIETHHHFRETLRFRDDVVAAWNLNLRTISADEPRPGLWRTGTTDCCQRHKVAPLFAALAEYDTWFTGLRRDQSPSRASLAEVEEFPLPGGIIRKVNPLAGWTRHDVQAYATIHHLPVNPLHADGFPSIGCEPCTTRPLDPADPRSGRWGGARLECGIHIATPGDASQ